MSLETRLADRSGGVCELCGSTAGLGVFEVPPGSDDSVDQSILTCEVCRTEIDGTRTPDANHWRCLNESIWSTVPAVQVVGWRMLHRLQAESWARELLETAYLEENVLKWAQSGLPATPDDEDAPIPTVDANGTVLQTGNNVTLIKDLDVKGGGFTAKRGTLVKNISLTNNPKHVEGKINGSVIVLVAAYLKKA